MLTLPHFLLESLPNVHQKNAISWLASSSLWFLSSGIAAVYSAFIRSHLGRLQSSGRINVRTGHFFCLFLMFLLNLVLCYEVFVLVRDLG